MPPLNTASTESISSRKRTWLHPPSLFCSGSAKSRTEIVARARAQFQGSNEDFLSLAEEYDAIAPRLRGGFSKRSGCPATTSIPEGSPLSLAVSPETGGFLRNMVLSQRPARIMNSAVRTAYPRLYFAEALRTLGRGVVVRPNVMRSGVHLRAHVMTARMPMSTCGRATCSDRCRTGRYVRHGVFDVWADAYLGLFKQIERLLRRDRSYWPTTCTQPRTPFDRTSTTSITTRGFRPRPWTLNRESNLRSSFIEWRCRRCGSSMGSRAKNTAAIPLPEAFPPPKCKNPAFRAGFGLGA